MSSVNTELFDVFVQAKAALEELPAAKARAEAAEASLETGNAIIAQMEAEAKALRAELDAARLAIAQREADLAHATFQHNEAQQVLGNLRRMLGAEPAVDSPKPALSAESEPPVHQEGEAQPQGQREVDPTPETNVSSAAQSVENVSTSVDTDIGDVATPDAPAPEVASAPPANPSAEPQPGPTANYGTTSPSATQEPMSVDGSSARPHAGLGYWRKPDAMPWSVWRDGGGEVPHWVAHAELEAQAEPMPAA